MAVIVKHPFVSAATEGADPNKVRKSNWNADHTVLGAKEVITANVTKTVKSSGGDYTTLQAAIDSLKNVEVASNVYVKIELDNGVWAGAKIDSCVDAKQLRLVSKTAPIQTSITSIASTSGSAGDWYYVLNVANTNGAVAGDVLAVYSPPSGGVNPSRLHGAFLIDSVSPGAPGTITVYSVSQDVTAPSGAVATTFGTYLLKSALSSPLQVMGTTWGVPYDYTDSGHRPVGIYNYGGGRAGAADKTLEGIALSGLWVGSNGHVFLNKGSGTFQGVVLQYQQFPGPDASALYIFDGSSLSAHSPSITGGGAWGTSAPDATLLYVSRNSHVTFTGPYVVVNSAPTGVKLTHNSTLHAYGLKTYGGTLGLHASHMSAAYIQAFTNGNTTHCSPVIDTVGNLNSLITDDADIT